MSSKRKSIIIVSNTAYIKKLNRSQKVVKEGSTKMVAHFRRGMVPYFG
jgi:hypothetical protein